MSARPLIVMLIIAICATSVLAQSGRVRAPKERDQRSLSGSAPVATNTQPAAKALIIPKGTRIELHLNQSLSSKTNTKGEEFILKVSQPVFIEDQLVLGPSTAVKCHIISAQPAARKGRNGTLTIGFDEVVLDSGERVRLSATLVGLKTASAEDVVDKSGEGKINNPSKGRSAPVTIGTSTGIGATIGAISGVGIGTGAGIGAAAGVGSVLLSKGSDVELLSGTRLEVRLDADLNLAAKLPAEEKRPATPEQQERQVEKAPDGQ